MTGAALDLVGATATNTLDYAGANTARRAGTGRPTRAGILSPQGLGKQSVRTPQVGTDSAISCYPLMVASHVDDDLLVDRDATIAASGSGDEMSLLVDALNKVTGINTTPRRGWMYELATWDTIASAFDALPAKQGDCGALKIHRRQRVDCAGFCRHLQSSKPGSSVSQDGALHHRAMQSSNDGSSAASCASVMVFGRDQRKNGRTRLFRMAGRWLLM